MPNAPTFRGGARVDGASVAVKAVGTERCELDARSRRAGGHSEAPCECRWLRGCSTPVAMRRCGGERTAMGGGRARGQGMDGDVKVRMDGDGQQRRKALKLDCPALIIRTEPPSVWSLCTLLIEHHFRSPRGFG
jgi:hypothetical protein